MTRNEKIALAIGGGVITVGGLALYFMSTSKPPSTSTAPPIQPPTPTPASPPQSFAPTTTPAPQPTTAPHLTPASQFPPSWNQFTSVIAGHTYLITLTSPTPVDWATLVNPHAIPGSFNGPLRSPTPTPTQYVYSLTATVTHSVQNVMFLLGVTRYVDVTVIDLGVI